MQQRKILLLENVAAQAAGVRERLTQAGYPVAVSRYEADGFKRLAEWLPDLVLLSTAHPAGDLVEYCRRARALAPAARIVITSSLNRERLFQQHPDLEPLVDGVLLRPYSFEEAVRQFGDAPPAGAAATPASRPAPPRRLVAPAGDPAAEATLRRGLEPFGIEVAIVPAHGLAASCAERRPGVLVLEWPLPAEFPPEELARLRATPAGPAAVLLLADGSQESVSAAAPAVLQLVDMFFRKPVAWEYFFRVLARHFALPELAEFRPDGPAAAAGGRVAQPRPGADAPPEPPAGPSSGVPPEPPSGPPPDTGAGDDGIRAEFQRQMEGKFLEVEELKRQLEGARQAAAAPGEKLAALEAEAERLRKQQQEGDRKASLALAIERLKSSELEVKLDNLLRMKDDFERRSQDELEARVRELEEVRAALEEARAGAAKADAALAGLSGQLERAIVEKEQVEERLHRVESAPPVVDPAAAAAAAERLASLEVEAARLRAQSAEAEVALADALTKAAQLEEASARETADRAGIAAELERAERRVAELLAERAELEGQAIGALAARRSAEAALAESASRAAALERDAAASAARAATLERDAEESASRAAALERDAAASAARVATLERDAEESASRAAALERDAAALTARAAGLERDEAEAAARIAGLEQEAAKCAEALAQAEERCARAEEARAAQQARAEAADAARVALAAEAEEAVGDALVRVAALERELAEARAARPDAAAAGEVQERLAALEARLAASARELDAAVAARAAAESRLGERERELAGELESWRAKAAASAREAEAAAALHGERGAAEERARRELLATLDQRAADVAGRDRALADLERALAGSAAALADRDRVLADRTAEVAERDRALAERDRTLEAQQEQITAAAAAGRRDAEALAASEERRRTAEVSAAAAAESARAQVELAEAGFAREREAASARERELAAALSAAQAGARALEERLAAAPAAEAAADVQGELRRIQELLREVIARASADAAAHARTEAELLARLQSGQEERRQLADRVERIVAEGAERERRSLTMFQSLAERGVAAATGIANLPAIVPAEPREEPPAPRRRPRRAAWLAGVAALALLAAGVILAVRGRPTGPVVRDPGPGLPAPARTASGQRAPQEVWERWTRSDESGGVLVQATLRSEPEVRAEVEAERRTRGWSEAEARAELARRLADYRFDETYYVTVYLKHLAPGYPAYLDDAAARFRLRDGAGRETPAFVPPAHEKDRRVYSFGAGAPADRIYEATITLGFSRGALQSPPGYLQLVVSDVGTAARRVLTWELE
jgi:DNA-binding response OmpR family regulator